MPKIRLYGHDVRFHVSQISPFWHNDAAVRGHTAWNRITPKVWFRAYDQTPSNSFPGDFDRIANNFASAGLTGSQGETGAASWAFAAGATPENIGRAVAYMADMHRAFYANRGISHDGRYAWWPAGAGQAGYLSSPFQDDARQWALFANVYQDPNTSVLYVHGNGNTSDYLTISSWTGATASQLAVQASTPYIVAGLTAFQEWVRRATRGLTSALATRIGVTGPAILAGDWEQTPSFAKIFEGSGANEMGVWQQMLNDPRASTYRFFDRHTLVELWGATGGSAQYGRSPHQWAIPFTITAPNNSADAFTNSTRPIDIIWQRRDNMGDYMPNFNNFYSSLMQRHREHLWSRAFDPYRAAFPGSLVGNYQNTPSTKVHPNMALGKVHSYLYTCDLGCTGPAGATVGYNDASVTGTFSLDYAAPVCYIHVPSSNQVDVQNWIPNIGYWFVGSHYEGPWGSTQTVGNIYERVSFGYQIMRQRAGAETGLFQIQFPNVLADYTSFLQNCGKQRAKMWQQRWEQSDPATDLNQDGFVDGQDYFLLSQQGYTGGNILDLRNYWISHSKNLINNTRNSLDSFNDNSNKPIVPWIGNESHSRWHSIFSLTASSSSPYFADANGITNFNINPYGPLSLDYQTAFIKYAIQQHGVTDFLVFESGVFGGTATTMQALDFWNNAIVSLALDSNNAPVANIAVSPSNDQRDNTNTGVQFVASGTGSSDPDDHALTYRWSLSNGITASGPTAAFTLTAGNYTLDLTVTDIYGATGATNTQILVRSNVAPTAHIAVTPNANFVYDTDNNGSEPFAFDGNNSSDPHGGSISAYQWYLNGIAGATTSNINLNVPVGINKIKLVVTDNGGLTAETSRSLVVSTPPPGGAQSKFLRIILFNGRIYTRQEFDNLLRTLHPGPLALVAAAQAPAELTEGEP